MPCPFARYASMVALSPGDLATLYSHHAGHDHAQPALSSSSTSAFISQYPLLSDHLKQATAKAHRQVESSAGVRKLLGFGKASTEADGDGKVFGRLDYIRWMIMLGCIYAALESSILAQHASQAPMLVPLLKAVLPTGGTALSSPSRLLPHLLRLPLLLRDIDIHLQILGRSSGNEEGAGLDWAELVEEYDEQIQDADRATYDELAKCMSDTSQASLVAVAVASSSSSSSPSTSPHINSQHLRLLTPTEAESTLLYVKRLQALSAKSGDLLLSHAYVRYLGDLSGGQHIRKRVEKLFPLDDEGARTALASQGYEFYDFSKTEENEEMDAVWHRRLKDAFRTAMDSAISSALVTINVAEEPISTFSPLLFLKRSVSSQTSRDFAVSTLLTSQGLEACLAFELNKDLFEGLIGARPTTVIGSIPSTHLSQRPTTYTANSDSFLTSSTSSVTGDETETDFSSDEESSRGGESRSLLAKHLNFALAPSFATSTVVSAPAAVVFATAKASMCPMTKVKNAVAAVSPMIATAVLVVGTVVLLKATLPI